MAVETGGQNQPQIQVNMSHSNTPSKKNSPKRPEGIDGNSQSTQNSPDQDNAHPPTQIGQSYGQPVQKLVIQSNGQQQQIQNNGQHIQQNPIPAHHAQMQVLQQAPQQQSLFHQPSQQQQQIVNQQLLGHNAFALQQQPFMFQQQMIPQQKIQHSQQQSIQQMYQPQQQVAMIQAPILYAAQPAAVVSNTASGTVAAPSSATNTPVQKAIKKGRFRVVKPGKQEPNETVGDGQSVVSSTSENPPDAASASVTTKKKGRFIVRTKSIADSAGLSPTKEMVSETEKSSSDDTLTKSASLPPQLPLSSDKGTGAASASNVKKKGRFRVKSGVPLADAETSSSSDKVGTHARKPSDDTKISSMGDVTTAEENIPSIASNSHVPGSNQIPQGVKPMSSNPTPQYTTFVPSMTSYDMNNQVMMVSAPFVTTQNTSMPMMQTSMQQPQMQQMYQNQIVQQQQQQQQVPPATNLEQEAPSSSHPLGLPLSNPNSPTPRTEPLQTQPQVPQLPQQARSNSPIPKRPTASSAQSVTTSGSGGWRGISGSQGKNGRLIGCGGVGKILHNLDCLRQEVLDADKCITSLQSDNRFLRNKNKELEAKISSLEKRLVEEKSLRRSTDAKLQTLRQKVKELEPTVKNETQVGEEGTLPADCQQVAKVVEEKSNASTAPAVTHTPSVTKTTEAEEIEVVLESKSQTSPPPKKSSSLNQVEGEPKPKSPQPTRRALGSMSDLDVASLSKPQDTTTVKQFDPLAPIAPAPPLCPPTSSVVMAQNFQSLVDDNIAPIPMIVTTQMPTADGDNNGIETKASDSVQHFDPLGTPEKSQSQLNLQTLVINPVVPSVPALTHLNGSPAIATATVPIYTLPIPTIQLPPQHQQMQPKQPDYDPFDDIICRNQNVEQNGNGHDDSIR